MYRGNVLGTDGETFTHGFADFFNKTIATWPRAPKHPDIISNFTTAFQEGVVPLIYNNFFCEPGGFV